MHATDGELLTYSFSTIQLAPLLVQINAHILGGLTEDDQLSA